MSTFLNEVGFLEKIALNLVFCLGCCVLRVSHILSFAQGSGLCVPKNSRLPSLSVTKLSGLWVKLGCYKSDLFSLCFS
jgi:hypothetical protein